MGLEPRAQRDASEPSEAPVGVHAELKRLMRENRLITRSDAALHPAPISFDQRIRRRSKKRPPDPHRIVHQTPSRTSRNPRLSGGVPTEQPPDFGSRTKTVSAARCSPSAI